MAERAIDVRSGGALLRRRWRVLTAVAAGGLGLGLLYGSVVPLQVGSRSLVLISAGSGSSGDTAADEINTQVQLVLSTPILERAGRAVVPVLSPQQVEQSITVNGQTSQILAIEAFSPNAARAQALSQAVAAAFVSTIQGYARTATGATVAQLHVREGILAGQVQDLEQQMNAVDRRTQGGVLKGAPAVRDAQLKTELLAEQSDLVLQLDQVKAQIEASANSGTAPNVSVVQSAAPARGADRLPVLLTWTVIGGLLGLVLAAAAVVIRARRDQRLRARDDLADAVGSSVLGDVRSRPQRSVAEWSALFESYQASAVDAWAFRQLLRVLADAQDETIWRRNGMRRRPGRIEHPASLALISLSGDNRGLAVGPQLAAFAASLGITTRVVVASGDDRSASLWAACSTARTLPLRPGLSLEAGLDGRGDERAGVAGVAWEEVRSLDDLLVATVPSEAAAAATEAGTGEADGIAPDGTASAGDDADDADDADGPEASDESDEADRHASAGGGHDAEGGRPVRATEGDLVPLAGWSRRSDGGAVPRHASTNLTIVLVVADPREPDLQKLPPTSTTVLAIAPGVGTREDLARLAVAVDDTGRRLNGIVLADPDPSDRTTGRHTLDERARQAPLPLRVTGIGQTSTAFTTGG